MIKTHKELAEHIAGKNILHLNSYGKDSAVCLEWLSTYAFPARIVALHFEFQSQSKFDLQYLKWQKQRYRNVEFISLPNPHELTNIVKGLFQNPLKQMNMMNSFEYGEFAIGDLAEEFRVGENLDYISMGHSKYESVARASRFYKEGLVQNKHIYPIGMMTKKQILGLIKSRKIKLHQAYKFGKSTQDLPSYYKMRSMFISDPSYKKSVYKVFPLLALDEYRWERLM